MKCDRCNRPAVVHQLVIKDGNKHEMHLCEAHAAEAGIPNPGKHPVNELMSSLTTQVKSAGMPTCKGCGCTLTDIRKSSRFGCPQCYDAFGQATEALVRSAQGGSSQHVGRAPLGQAPENQSQYESQRLVQELDRAVRAEQYERAAEIKSKLADLADQRPSKKEDTK
ncbi:MAG: hypothetical protein MK100_01475 [Phycisphaerales bacterium]|nr:hypothetical protein [Phycisphaerales bacterium]